MEDPSLRVTRDPQTLQHLIHGMGSLHLQVAHHRLVHELFSGGLQVQMGPVRIAYRETINVGIADAIEYQKGLPSGRLVAGLGLSLEPEESHIDPLDMRIDPLDALLPSIPDTRQLALAIEEGIQAFLQQGILAGYPWVGVRVRLTSLTWTAGESSTGAFRAAAHELMLRMGRSLASAGHVRLAEPTARLRLSCPRACLGSVLQDLHGSRRALMLEEEEESESEDSVTINAVVPLAEMTDYASALRGLTKGMVASFELEPTGAYQIVQSRQQEQVLLNK